jgi:hypothetical protein
LHQNNKLNLHDDVIALNPPHFRPQNIYITCDEEIKDEEWHLHYYKGDPGISKSHNGASEFINLKAKEFGYNKIILTTDQDLIKDGVQSIDDEFLEWFVNNPTCEEVEVKLENYYASGALQPNLWQYKVIIPKDEPKQERMYSEEEVLGFGKFCVDKIASFLDGKGDQTDGQEYSMEELFDQFKKK